MWKTLWASITRPPGLAITVGLDKNTAKVPIEGSMPLFLQLCGKQAGVRAKPILMLVLLL